VGWQVLVQISSSSDKDIIEHCPLPIGLTNEEASEANNKILRNVRLHHTRKTSWSDGMSDLYHRMMDLSDPVVLDNSQQKKKKKEKKSHYHQKSSVSFSPL
jgi:hypothetical protein